VSGINHDLAISPDGSRVVYVGGSGSQLFARAMDQLEATPLIASGGPADIFMSPDGQWVGFVDNRTTLKKVAITGGPPITICRVIGGRGGTWGPDNTIIFASFDSSSGLLRVSAAGGEPTVLTRPNRDGGERDHFWPHYLPNGEAVLFTIVPNGSIEDAQVAVLDLKTGQHKILIRGGTDAHYVPSGHLVYAVGTTLQAIAFDLNRLEVVGTPTPVVQQVSMTADGAADFDVARDGTLVYVPGGTQAAARTLAWVDRQGREEPVELSKERRVRPLVQTTFNELNG
jgi:serine/threonine-protein kinase